MKRSLRKRLATAVHQASRDRTLDARVFITFPAALFADAPVWAPGEAFQVAIEHRSWYSREPDGSIIAVVGEIWIDDRREVWTVRLPNDQSWLFQELWDKPHRLRHVLDSPDYHDHTILERTPYDQHPLKAVETYWAAFEERNGFKPHLVDEGRRLPSGNYWLVVSVDPYDNLDREAAKLLRLVQDYGATIKVYNWRPRHNETANPREIYLADDILLISRYAHQ